MTTPVDSFVEDAPQEIAGVPFVSRHMGDLAADELQALIEQWRSKLGSGVIALTATDGGLALLVVAVTADLTARIDAVSLVQAGAEALGGDNDEGTRALAQGSGPTIDNAADALSAVATALEAELNATLRGDAEAIA